MALYRLREEIRGRKERQKNVEAHGIWAEPTPRKWRSEK